MKGFGDNKKLNKRISSSQELIRSRQYQRHIAYAKELLIKGNLNQSKSICEDLIKKGFSTYDLYYLLALINRESSNYDIAQKLLTSTISRYPKEIDQYILISEILRLNKQYSKAKQYLESAQEISPDNSNIYYNLSLLFKDLKSYKLALQKIDKAIAISPSNYIYLQLKADLQFHLGEIKESKEILYKLLNTRIKDKTQIMLLLSTVLKFEKEFVKAEEILIDILNHNQNFLIAYLNLGSLYFEWKLLEKAEEIILKGLKIQINSPALHFNLALVYRSQGAFNKSIIHSLKAISINKNLFKAYENISDISNFSEYKEEEEYIFNVSFENLNAEDIYTIAFTRANILHKKKNYTHASHFYKLANSVKSKLFLSDKAQLIKEANLYNSTFDTEHSKTRSNYDRNLSNNEILFIVGMPRSGSTLLENILSTNKNVFDLGECGILREIMQHFKFSENRNPHNLYLENLSNQLAKDLIFTDKSLLNFIYIPVINKFFPKSRIIYCVRNPLDNILSIYRTNFKELSFSTDLEEILELYIFHYELMLKYQKKYSNIIYKFNYDKLVTNKKLYINKLIQWLGWEWNEDFLEPQHNKRNIFTASSEQVRKPIHKKSVSNWKNYQKLLEPVIDKIKSRKDLWEKFD